MLKETGVAEPRMIRSVFPDSRVLVKPKAIIECYEAIPCDPCETACPTGAIEVGADINARPVLDVDACTGCRRCVTACPGLAIFVVSIQEDKAVFTVPYEMLPLPEEGALVNVADRCGQPIGTGEVRKVRKHADRTASITFATDKGLLYEAVTVVVDDG